MKKLVMLFIVIFSICMSSILVNAEDIVKFDENNSATVYLVKRSLVQENQTVRSVWVRYNYTKFGAANLKKEIKENRIPHVSKVKYAFDCDSNKHKVMVAIIYDQRGAVITSIKDGSIEEVIPGSVGEAIRNLTCNYNMEENKVGEQI